MSATRGQRGFGQRKGTVGMRERFKDARHDPYAEKKKRPDGTTCPRCGAVYLKGRWTWESPLSGGGEAFCPACRRIQDRFPAGELEISGAFSHMHAEEITGLLRNVEQDETMEHPLERIMDIRRTEDAVVVETTGIHLARRLGEALADAYEGDLSLDYGDGEAFVRIVWHRDA